MTTHILEVYADTAFGNQEQKMKSTEKVVIRLRGQGSKCAPISWKLKTLARVCKSAKTAETMAMENAADTAIGLGRQLNQIRTGKVTSDAGRIIVCTDSKSLIESVNSTKQVDEAPMRLNVAHLKDMKEKGDIMEFKWVPTEDMLADALTKQRVDPTILKKVLRTGYLKHP